MTLKRLIDRLLVLFFSLLLLSSCGRYVLKQDGLKQVRLGEPFHEVQTAKWRGVEKRDTLYSEAGYEWRGIILGMQEGKVVVEEDFFGKRTVNRIRVESPRFRTPLEVRVGDAAELLKARPFTWHLEVIPHYDRLDIFAEEFPSFHFLLPWTGDTTNLRPALSEVEGNIPIVGIVIM